MATRMVLLFLVGLGCSWGWIQSDRTVVLSEEEAKAIRGGQPGFWAIVLDAQCQIIAQCQDDGCGGAFPLSQCTEHVNRDRIVTQNDAECFADEFNWEDCICEQTRADGNCAVISATCQISEVGTPPVLICGAVPLTPGLTVSAPNDCINGACN